MDKLNKAIKFATDAHADQKRKLTNTPYILHPLEVASIVSTLCDDEDVLCAATLHDVVEDTNHTLEEIKNLFGDKVAYLVGSETENKRSDLPPSATWQIRKEETIAHLKSTTDKNVKILWLGDKLSNMRSIYAYYLKHGDEVWGCFHEKDKSKQKWYYESIVSVLKEDFSDTQAFKEYEKLVKNIFE